ncbi:MAG: ATP-binding cassette domain-containing protein [Sulfolobales archaeon]
MGKAIAVRGVSKYFGGIRALENIDLEISSGEVVGLIGPNGSGKSTLLNILRGHIKPDKGYVEIAGVEIRRIGSERLARLGVASIYQFPRIIGDLTVVENVMLGVIGYQQDPWRAELLALEYLKEVGLERKAYVRASKLNRYEVRLMELARAIAMKPKILLVDELLSGLSEGEQRMVREILETYLAQSNATIVWVEHAIGSLVEDVERLVVLNAGSIIADGEPEKVIRDEKVIKAYLGA